LRLAGCTRNIRWKNLLREAPGLSNKRLGSLMRFYIRKTGRYSVPAIIRIPGEGWTEFFPDG